MECSGRTKSHDASLGNTLVIWLGVEQDELHSQSACKQNSCLASVTQKARKVIVKKGLTTTKKAFLVNLKLVLSNIPNYYKARMGNDVIRHCAKLWIHLYPFICREKKKYKKLRIPSFHSICEWIFPPGSLWIDYSILQSWNLQQ